jgi:protein O-GlcNAc transferase
MDVALDSFPNGGCTTTCEALWMGVPVITLTGHSYVSRMSTAVLRGAGLHDWCATTQEHYLQLAVDCAGRLNELRQNRAHWRAQLVNNKIGDAADLMQHLEFALSQLYREYSLLDANKR